jgi:hypothetical protein
MCDFESFDNFNLGKQPVVTCAGENIPYLGEFYGDKIPKFDTGFVWVIASGSGFELRCNGKRINYGEFELNWI